MIRFINRKREFKLFEKYLEQITGRNLIIVYGNMGVGKSELVKRFLLSYRKYPAIKVPISHKDDFGAGYYLGKIKTFSEKPINEIKFNLTENKYLIKKNGLTFILKFFFNIAEEIPVISVFLKGISKNYTEYLNLKNSLADSSSKNSSVQIEDYLIHLYKDMPFVLNIENIQSIDFSSWNSLYNILRNVHNYSLILEYTPNMDENLDLSSIIEKYKAFIDDAHIQIVKVSKLDDEHVISIDPSLSDSEKENLQNKLEHWDGNLKEIENYLYFNKYKFDVDLSDSTEYIIDTLKKDVLEWLERIYLSAEEFSLQDLKKMGLPDKTYNILEKFRLIKTENNIVTTNHDTICSILDGIKYTSIKNNAILFWKNYYEQKYQQRDLHIIYKLLHFSILQNDVESLNAMLMSIRQYIISSADPVEYLKRIERVYYQNTVCNQNVTAINTLLFWITELYQNIGDYKKAFVFLNYISDKSSHQYIMLKALLLYQVGFQENAAAYCTEFIKSPIITQRMELFLRIIRLEAYYTLEEYEKVKSEYNYIKKNSEIFSNYLEYGFFLRNTELVKEPSEAVSDLVKSIHHFEKFNAGKQAVSSRITLGVCYALMGNFKQAAFQFKMADSKKEEFVGLYDMILTNQAVLLQYQGKLEHVKEKLLLAQKYAHYDFNKLAICINLLVYNIRTGKEDELLIEDILSLIKNKTFKNRRIICYAYINLYNYYKNKDEKLSSEYYMKIFDYSPLPYYINEWINEPTLSPNDPEYYRTRIKWPINFLDEWSIEFDSSLMNYE